MALNGNGAARIGRLKSWKEIAGFFDADERTVKRWEVGRGLPVPFGPAAMPEYARRCPYMPIGTVKPAI